MLILDMPYDFKLGDTQPCKINGEPRRVRWEEEFLVFLPPDADAPEDRRLIMLRMQPNADDPDGLHTFYCSSEAV